MPVLVRHVRGGIVEARGRGAAVALRGDEVLFGIGPWRERVFLRSCAKPFQTLASLDAGIDEAFELDEEELAVATASHDGTPEHVAVVERLLAKGGFSAGDLLCGTHPPFSAAAAAELRHRGEGPTALHNNCSGKHALFLLHCRRAGMDPRGYRDPDHPVQRRVRKVLGEWTGEDVEGAPYGVDGCGVPTHALPLDALARGFARLAGAGDLRGSRAAHVRRLLRAIASHPVMLGGRGVIDTHLIQGSGGRILAKRGAEGVYAAAVTGEGAGVAIKMEDGETRWVGYVLRAVLERVGLMRAADREVFEAVAPVERKNWKGVPVGHVEVAF